MRLSREAVRGLLCLLALFSIARVYGQPRLPGAVEPGQIEKQFERPPAPPPRRETIVPPSPTERAPPEAEGIRFVLNDILFDGMTAYSKQDLVPLYQSYVGKEISLALIYTIARALTSKYRNDGYILAQVIVPPQRVRDGAVRLQAIEGYIDQVEFRGDAIDRPSLVNAYAAKIKASRPLRADVLERYLLLLNDLPGMVARGTLLPAKRQQGASDLIITISQRRLGAALEIDNHASEFLGPWQATLDLAGYSALRLYENTALSLVSSLGNDELYFGSLSHEQPFGSEGTRVKLYASGVDSKAWARGCSLEHRDPLRIDGHYRIPSLHSLAHG